MITDFNQLPAHVRQAMQRVADTAGTDISNVDPAQFADLPESEDTSAMGRWARSNKAYAEEAAANRQAAELEELKRVAAADLPSNEEIAEMAWRYGISSDLLLAQYVEKKTAAIATLGKRQAAIEATRKAAEKQAAEAKITEAIASRDLTTLVHIGGDKSAPTFAVARAALAELWPSWKFDD